MLSSRRRRAASVLISLVVGSSAAARVDARPPSEAREWPAPTALVTTGEPSGQPLRFAPGAPATPASAKLLALTEQIDAERTRTVYTHRTKVRRADGVYEFDCSGMVNWMLQRVAKRAYETLDRERPVASSYVRVIAAAPTNRARGGWQRIARIGDVEPGDVFAWRRPADWPKGGNTGHVGLVVAKPARVPYVHNAWLVRIADSTRWAHQDDTRGEGETGFGMGTLLFATDDEGHPIGYGWHGLDSSGYFETQVVFGRVH